MTSGVKHTFHKSEKLSHKATIDALFQKKGQSIFRPPILLVYLKQDLQTPYPCQLLVSVSKRKFKKATDRNRIKRQLTEVYRLHKHRIYEAVDSEDKYAVGILYLDNKEVDFATLESHLVSAINEFIKRVS